MAYMVLKLPERPANADLAALKQALEPLASVQEPAAESFDLAGFALVIGLGANALQIADILFTWLQGCRSKGNTASIRLKDGRELTLEASSDPDVFLKQLKAALKDF